MCIRDSIFFIMAATFVPLATTPDAELLKDIAPGIIWVMALLATLLSAESLFASDYQDGSLEQLLISPQLIVMPVLGKDTVKAAPKAASRLRQPVPTAKPAIIGK